MTALPLNTYAWQGAEPSRIRYPVERRDLSPTNAIGDASTVLLAVAIVGTYAVASLIDVRSACRSEREAISYVAQARGKKAVRLDVHTAVDVAAARRAVADLRGGVA